MAFCNSCGTQVEVSAKFCPKCGAAVPAAAASPAPPSPLAVAPQTSRGLKIILIVGAVVIGLGILGAATGGFMAWRIAHHSRVESRGGKLRVETPFGRVESTDNPEDAARNLGVEVYPGAHALKGNTANVTVGGMHTVAAEFETNDPPDKVFDFYKLKFPKANIAVADQNHYTIVSTDKKNLITINIEPGTDATRIHIANVTGKASGDGDTTN